VIIVTTTESNESYRLEIEIASVLLGFLFVMDTIVLTMSDDVLNLAKNTYMTGYLGIPILSFGDLFSLASLYCSLALLVAIPCYFLHLRIRKKVILLIARTFLAVSMYLIVILVVVINGAFMIRLVGTQSNAYMNPISGYALSIAVMAMIAYILYSWIAWLYKIAKGSQGNANRQSMKNKDKGTTKPQRQKSS
jgi:hypothetical protein